MFNHIVHSLQNLNEREGIRFGSIQGDDPETYPIFQGKKTKYFSLTSIYIFSCFLIFFYFIYKTDNFQLLKQVHQECMIPFSLSTCLSGVLHLFLICFKLFFGSFLHFDLCFTLLIKSIRFVSFDSSHICILYMFKNCVRTDLLLCLFLGCREMFCYHFPKCVCV